jgi:hypothetical protein
MCLASSGEAMQDVKDSKKKPEKFFPAAEVSLIFP